MEVLYILKENKLLLVFFMVLFLISCISVVSATNSTVDNNISICDNSLESNNLKKVDNVENSISKSYSSENNYYFNASVTDDNGNGSKTSPWKTINNNRISSMSNNSQVYISNGKYNISENINFTNSMNIIGEDKSNTVFYSLNESWFYVKETANVTISDVFFTEEYTINITNHKSSIVNYGYLSLNNTIFKDNYAAYGGAIVNLGTLNINNSQFINNSADNFGCVIYSDFYKQESNLFIYNSIFLENQARNENKFSVFYGGNVICAKNTMCIIDNSSFCNNNINSKINKSYGGVLFFEGCLLNIYNSNFINNSANIGGSIYILNGEINIDSCIFRNSSALYGWGGAVSMQNCSSTIKKTDFINCSSFNNVAGALMIYQKGTKGVCLDKINTVVIEDSVFINNSANYGGAICSLGIVNTSTTDISYLGGVIPSVVNITNSLFLDNLASFDGGAIYSMYSNITSINNGFGYNKINNTKSLGGTIFAYRGNLTINKSGIMDNNNISYAIYNHENDLNITNSIIETNHAIDNTPYIKLNTTRSKFTIESNWWTNNNPNWKQQLNDIKYTPKTWTIMKFTNTTPLNETTINLTLSLNTLNNGKPITDLPIRYAVFNATNGILKINETFIQGEINNTHTGNYGDITATIDGYTIKLSNKEIPTLTSNNITTTPGKTIQITANINNDTTGYAIIKINNNTISPKIRITNGQITYNYTIPGNYQIKNYTITIKYSGDKKYQNNTINTILTLEKTNTIIQIKPITTTPKTNTLLEAIITNDQGYKITSGNVVFKINNKTITPKIQVTNGIAQYNYTTPKQEKTYNITVAYSGNKNTNPNRNDSQLTITKNTTQTNNLSSIYTTTNPVVVLPETYDLRKLGLVTPVKNQAGKGSCWAFGIISVIESTLLKQSHTTYNFSENHMQNMMGLYSLIGTNMYDFGTFYMSMGYLASWLGVVNSSDDPYQDFNMISPKIDEIFHIQDIIWIDTKKNVTDNDKIKEAIIKYGALETTYCHNNKYYNEITHSYYLNETEPLNHAISIVGWDDNYDKNNFNIPAPANGAFIVKNSWGNNWGEDGYFYLSYYDTVFASAGCLAIPSVESVDNYDHNYQYETIPITIKTYEKDTVWYANQFTSKQDETLEAISTYFLYNLEYKYQVQVYVNNELKLTQNDTTNISGYKTIKLDKQISLNKGDVFKVVIKLEIPNFEAYIPIQASSPTVNKGSFKANCSFISPDGEHWEDISYSTEYINANVCIKAFTKDN
ncbi:MAG: C1 family peptidase [Methanobacteriaceae archaeon]|nr:C1 family peptidase [Methanobacteriaceae archaeon]